MLKSWEDYSVALGDVVTIVSASGKKIELSVVGTIDMGDTDYNGTYFFDPGKCTIRDISREEEF